MVVLSAEDTSSKLPIWNYKDTILELIRKNFVTLIIGDTGCGKSTQIPQYILDDTRLQHILLKVFVFYYDKIVCYFRTVRNL